jgi:hypothetical protein
MIDHREAERRRLRIEPVGSVDDDEFAGYGTPLGFAAAGGLGGNAVLANAALVLVIALTIVPVTIVTAAFVATPIVAAAVITPVVATVVATVVAAAVISATIVATAIAAPVAVPAAVAIVGNSEARDGPRAGEPVAGGRQRHQQGCEDEQARADRPSAATIGFLFRTSHGRSVSQQPMLVATASRREHRA